MVLCNKTHPGETQHTHLPTPDCDPLTKVWIPLKSNLVNQEVLYWSYLRKCSAQELLTGAEMTQRQLITKPTPAGVGTWSTGHGLYTAQQAGGRLLQGLQLSKPLAASSSGLCFFQAAALKSESPCSVTSTRACFAAFTGCPGREGPDESG